MTVTDTPTRRFGVDEAQLLFEEARQRRRRRWLIGGIASLAFVVLFGTAIGLWAIQSGGGTPRPVSQPSPALPPAAVAGSGFSIRPVLCYAPPYSLAPGQQRSTGPLPTCSPSTQLTASSLQVAPDRNDVNGFTMNTSENADPQFTTYPSTPASSQRPNQDVLLPGTPANGAGRFVLGPTGLTGSAIAHAWATHDNGQWTISLTLTSKGSALWDALARHTFHEITGVVINGQVVSAPIVQPAQSSFTSFNGQLQVSGGFTEHQAKSIASSL